MGKLSFNGITLIESNHGSVLICGCFCILLALLLAVGGSITMITFGSTCIDTGIFTLCGSDAGAICLVIFGILLCFGCCFVVCCVHNSKKK